MNGDHAHEDGAVVSSPPRKKARKGKKKSKAERLARGLLPTTATATSTDAGDLQSAAVSIVTLQELLDAPTSTSSSEWDRAQAIALRVGSEDAKKLMVRSLVFSHRHAQRAAVHYAKRLRISQASLVDVLLEGCDEPLQCLCVAKFLADADESLVDNATRIKQFLLPWLDRYRADARVVVVDDVDDATGDTTGDGNSIHHQLHSAFFSAVKLVLQVNASQSKTSLGEEKGRLQQALVKHLLLLAGDDDHHQHQHHRGVMLQYASALAPVLANAAAVTKAEDVNVTSSLLWEREALATERRRRFAVASRTEELLKLLWPDARVVVFGSSTTGLLVPVDDGTEVSSTSQDDVDLCVLLPSCPSFFDATAPLIADIKDHLALYMDETTVVAVTRARVPIVRWTDPLSGLQCDLCINNLPALWNTQLTTQLVRSHCVVNELSLWIKKWFKTHAHAPQFGGGFASAISSYGMQLLVLYYLQRRGVLPASIDCGPCVLDEEALRTTLDNTDNTGKIQRSVQHAIAKAQADKAHTVAEAEAPPRPTLWSLVVDFFAFYGANQFDFEHAVVSLRDIQMTKAHSGWARRNWKFSLCIQDPIEIDRDLGTLFSRLSLTRFRTALVATCVAIADAHDANETATHAGRERVLGSLLVSK